jgi:hypothetical protein
MQIKVLFYFYKIIILNEMQGTTCNVWTQSNIRSVCNAVRFVVTHLIL